ncbi:MAG: thioredoxin domain-containing protein [Betaproteobacteria bacterium]|nr:thioredoxin domain-containing protein [Betaproteobacteria bacterium]
MKPLENRLADALSPYLRQHAANPVAWQPWDDEALQLAVERDLPIMLSIGYAACHWCHVMEKESFSDPKIAELLNNHFIPIKVDREEHPDLDRLFQSAHFMIASVAGGWPLTVFMDPNQVPFFSGTYFPPRTRGSLPAFSAVLDKVIAVWRKERTVIERQNRRLMRALHAIDRSTGRDRSSPPGQDDFLRWARIMANDFDPINGGMGKAPKFPQAPSLLFTLEMAASGFGGSRLRENLTGTFDAMAARGLHDHVEGGFFRYCVDPVLDIPHFEKMLSDNALLTELYALAAVVFARDDYRDLAIHTGEWMIKVMGDAGGGFVSSIDADAAGVEGGSYLWSAEQLAETLSPAQLEFFGRRSNISSIANFADVWHIRLLPHIKWSKPAGEEKNIRAILNAARQRRVQPQVDDKVLAQNCALAARALAKAGRLLAIPEWIDRAAASLDFCSRNLVVDGKLRSVWRDGRCSLALACLDDHALIGSAWLEIFKGRGKAADLAAATDAAATMLAEFDDRRGGLRFVSRHRKDCRRIVRSGEDAAVPSGNGIAVQLLLELGWLTGDSRLLDAAERILGAFASLLCEQGRYCSSLLAALWRRNSRSRQVAVFGQEGEVRRWCAQLARANPFQAIYPVAESTELPGMLAQSRPPQQVQAKICRAGSCSLPITSLDEAIGQAGYDPEEVGL